MKYQNNEMKRIRKTTNVKVWKRTLSFSNKGLPSTPRHTISNCCSCLLTVSIFIGRECWLCVLWTKTDFSRLPNLFVDTFPAYWFYKKQALPWVPMISSTSLRHFSKRTLRCLSEHGGRNLAVPFWELRFLFSYIRVDKSGCTRSKSGS